MTTKKYQVSTNLKVFEGLTSTFSSRKEAIKYITDVLEDNSQINPQDLILEEVEVVDEEAILMDAASKIAKALEQLCYNYETKPYFSDNSCSVELRNKAQSSIISNTALKRLFETVDEVNADLPEGHEVWFNITDGLSICIFMGIANKVG